MRDLNELYYTQGWGRFAEEALFGLAPEHVESQAREVARYAVKVLKAKDVEIRGWRERALRAEDTKPGS